MIIHTSNYDDYENSTICVDGCQKDWLEISQVLNEDISLIEIISDSKKNAELIEYKGKYVDSFRIVIDDLISSSQFTINIIDDILIFNGARKSFNNLQNLSNKFAKDYTLEGDHLHLSYIDDLGDKFNWFSNKNIDLILAVRSDF